jgi:ribosomal protein S18 acetylase RimI-like enzyme
MSNPDALICALEAHAAGAWPATVARATADGWLLRATPGLDRGRSNNALTPCRELAAAEIAAGVDAIEAFAVEHGIRAGVQVSPLDLHGGLDAELDTRGYDVQWPTAVLLADAAGVAVGAAGLIVEDHASDAWLAAWARAEGREDAAAHAATVFARLAGRGLFARLGCDAAGLAVPGDGFAGLFSLAVAPAARRRGLGARLVRALAAAAGEPRVYLQVEETNDPALGLYEALGFTRLYRYRHRVRT